MLTMNNFLTCIRVSLCAMLVSGVLLYFTRVDFFLTLFIIFSIIFVIVLSIVLLCGESINNKNAKATYKKYLNTSLKEGFDAKEVINCSGAWHIIPSKISIKTLLVHTNYKSFNETIIDDFLVSKAIYNRNGLFAIDKIREKILLLNMLTARYKLIDYSALLSVSIETDGKVVSQRSTIRTIGGAMVGGALMGNTGAVIGAFSGNMVSGQAIKMVKVKFVMRDEACPTFDLLLLNMYGAIKPSDPDYNKVSFALSIANEMKALATVVIDKVDKADMRIQENASKTMVVSSIADEISKLADLKDKGVLTEEEFNIQKQHYLQRNINRKD